jgi:hypothetical protein
MFALKRKSVFVGFLALCGCVITNDARPRPWHSIYEKILLTTGLLYQWDDRRISFCKVGWPTAKKVTPSSTQIWDVKKLCLSCQFWFFPWTTWYTIWQEQGPSKPETTRAQLFRELVLLKTCFPQKSHGRSTNENYFGPKLKWAQQLSVVAKLLSVLGSTIIYSNIYEDICSSRRKEIDIWSVILVSRAKWL